MMTAALAWKPPVSAMSKNFSGLLDKLVAKHGISEVDHDEFQAFIDAAGNGVALLTEEPDTAAESWDMAVFFPELLAVIGSDLRAAVVRPESARLLQTRFGLGRLPALLFVRDGGYVGAIEGVRDWSQFVGEAAEMLQKPISRAPSVGIAVSVISSSTCH
jgi:hydrogenase-1 operon protein HyaE